jgi:hypothetical protein
VLGAVGGIKWSILYHQALIQILNAKIKEVWAKIFKFLIISGKKFRINLNQEFLTKFCV